MSECCLTTYGPVLNKGASVRAKYAPHIMQRLSRASQRSVRTCTLSQCCVTFEELPSALLPQNRGIKAEPHCILPPLRTKLAQMLRLSILCLAMEYMNLYINCLHTRRRTPECRHVIFINCCKLHQKIINRMFERLICLISLQKAGRLRQSTAPQVRALQHRLRSDHMRSKKPGWWILYET